MCTDPMASMIHDHDQELEYEAIEKELRSELDDFELSIERNVLPHKLANRPFDIYLFDFGGMMPGCEDMVEGHYRELIRQIENHPNSVFILYSSFSVRWYKECMELESKELASQPNVTLELGGLWSEFVRDWFKESP